MRVRASETWQAPYVCRDLLLILLLLTFQAKMPKKTLIPASKNVDIFFFSLFYITLNLIYLIYYIRLWIIDDSVKTCTDHYYKIFLMLKKT